MNKIRHKEEAQAPEKKVQSQKEKAGDTLARRFIRAANVFSYFDRRMVVSFMPYLFFLFLLALLYIGNSYYAEKTIRDIDRTEKELKELRSQFITGRNELMYHSKLTEVASAIRNRGVKESTEAPRKIVVQKQEQN